MLTTTQKIARNATLFATLAVAVMFYFVPDMVWWGYIVTWLFFAVFWYNGGVKQAARDNLANLRDNQQHSLSQYDQYQHDDWRER